MGTSTDDTETHMLFITEYQVIGSRCNGTYLVNADTKRQANSIVKAIDIDYCRCKSFSQEEFGEEDFEMMTEDVIVPKPGHAIQLECGT
jgi:hypothetical protein